MICDRSAFQYLNGGAQLQADLRLSESRFTGNLWKGAYPLSLFKRPNYKYNMCSAICRNIKFYVQYLACYGSQRNARSTEKRIEILLESSQGGARGGRQQIGGTHEP